MRLPLAYLRAVAEEQNYGLVGTVAWGPRGAYVRAGRPSSVIVAAYVPAAVLPPPAPGVVPRPAELLAALCGLAADVGETFAWWAAQHGSLTPGDARPVRDRWADPDVRAAYRKWLPRHQLRTRLADLFGPARYAELRSLRGA